MTPKRSTGRTGRPVKVPGETPTRQKIFDAAVDLFSERGFDRTSVRDIAKAAGITESAVYRHYPSKDAILGAIFEYTENKVYTPILPEQGVDGPTKTIFRDIFKGTIQVLLSDPYLIKVLHIMFIEMNHNPEVRERLNREYGDRADDFTEMMFKASLDDGSIHSSDPRALAILFNRFRMAWLFQTFIIDHRQKHDADEIMRELEGPIRQFEELTGIR